MDGLDIPVLKHGGIHSMVISLSGTRMSLTSVRTTLAGAAVASVLGIYVYGPPVTPLLHASAVARCNDLTGGSFRNFHLEWTVTAHPHWRCWDLRDLANRPTDLGWWVTPRL